MLPTLERHSASGINSFIEYRSEWAMQKIFKCSKFSENVDTARGKAIEEGINFWVDGIHGVKDDSNNPIGSKNPDKCAEHAVKVFNDYVKDIESEKKIDYVQTIYPSVIEAITSYGQRYKVKEMQKQYKIEGRLPGCKKPLVGYLDYIIPGQLVVDNKVKGKSLTQLPQGYLIQGAIYNFITGLPVEFHFEIPLKKETKIIVLRQTKEECEYGLNMAIEAAKAIEKIFDGIESGLFDFDMLKSIFFPNMASVFGAEKQKEMADHYFV